MQIVEEIFGVLAILLWIASLAYLFFIDTGGWGSVWAMLFGGGAVVMTALWMIMWAIRI